MISSVDSAKIRNILVFALSNIGDAVLNTPVISVLKEQFPDSYLCLLISPKAAPIFAGSKLIDEIAIYDKHTSWLQKLSLVRKLRKKKFDLIVDLRNSAIPFFVGAKYRTSYFVDRSAPSMRKRHLDRIRFLISSEPHRNRFDFFSDTEKKSAVEKAKAKSAQIRQNEFVIIAPGAGSALKRWNLSGFAEVINHFTQKKKKSVVLIGWDQEHELGVELERMASGPIINLIGALNLRESAGLISQASLVIANDSAVMHLAHELNRPTVSIFGPTDPKKYSQIGANRRMVKMPLDCSPCEAATCQLERRICLDDLPSSSVIQASEELLNLNYEADQSF